MEALDWGKTCRYMSCVKNKNKNKSNKRCVGGSIQCCGIKRKKKKEKIGGCLCCQGVDLGIGKDCICKYITIIINNEKKHEAYYIILRALCV